MDVDLTGKTDVDLNTLIAKTTKDFETAGQLLVSAEAELRARANRRYETALAEIMQRAKETGRVIQIREYGRKASMRPKAKYPKGTVYQHRENHDLTWESGKGKAPGWMANYGEPVPAKEETSPVLAAAKVRPPLAS